MRKNVLPYSKYAQLPKTYFTHQIAISGATGVGTSTTVKNLKDRLDDPRWKSVSAGAIMRGFARERGIAIEELAKYNRVHPEAGYDRRCDDATRAEGLDDYRILEGRLAHVFAPKAFHVLLKCPGDVRALRRYGDDVYVSVNDGKKLINDRDTADNKRYAKLYPGCLWPESDFDLVLDTSKLSPGDVVQKILTAHKKWEKLP